MSEPDQQDTSARMNANTVDAVLAFLEVKVRSHELSVGAGNPLITGVKKIVEVGDDVPTMSLDDLDVEALIERFRNKNVRNLTDASAQAYASRFRRSVTMYTKWRNREPWNVGGRAQRAGTKNRDGKSRADLRVRGEEQSSRRTEDMLALLVPDGSPEPKTVSLAKNESPLGRLFDYPVLLDSGATAVLRLPARYNRDDATRMKALIDALARDEQPTSGDN